MYGPIGLIVLTLLIGFFSIVGFRSRRTRHSPELGHVLKSGLLARPRPGLKNDLLRIEQALTYSLLSKFGGRGREQPGQAKQVLEMIELQERLEEVELRAAQLQRQNAELSEALSGKGSAQPGQAKQVLKMIELQERLEETELRAAQLQRQNAKLSEALAEAERVLERMTDIAKGAMESAGLSQDAPADISTLAVRR